MAEVFYYLEIVRARPAALYGHSDPDYKDASKQLSRCGKQLSWCVQWVAVIWKKVNMWLN